MLQLSNGSPAEPSVIVERVRKVATALGCAGVWARATGPYILLGHARRRRVRSPDRAGRRLVRPGLSRRLRHRRGRRGRRPQVLGRGHLGPRSPDRRAGRRRRARAGRRARAALKARETRFPRPAAAQTAGRGASLALRDERACLRARKAWYRRSRASPPRALRDGQRSGRIVRRRRAGARACQRPGHAAGGRAHRHRAHASRSRWPRRPRRTSGRGHRRGAAAATPPQGPRARVDARRPRFRGSVQARRAAGVLAARAARVRESPAG